MPYTSHGYWYGDGEPTEPVPPSANCGGPGVCGTCRSQAGGLHPGGWVEPRGPVIAMREPGEEIIRPY